MATWNIIKLSEIRPDRNDAEYFRNDYQLNLKYLANTGQVVSLGKLFNYINRGKQPLYNTSGKIKVLRSVNVGFMNFNETRQEYITDTFYNLNTSGKVQKDDILITSTGVGTLGRTSVWFKTDRAFCDGHITILRHGEVDPYCVTAFLNSKYGLIQFEQNYRGSSGQIEIYPYDISKFIFPECLLPFQIEIGNNLREAFELQENSQFLYQQASALLEKELGLDTMSFEKPRSYTATFSEVMVAKRADSEHFTPLFEKLKTLLSEKENVDELKHVLTYCNRGKQPRYSLSGLVALNSKHIRENKVIFNNSRKAETPAISCQLITKNDVLLNGTGVGTIGRAAPYLEDFQSVPDHHVTILRSDKLDCGYLSVYLNSRAGQIQVNKHLRGSSGQIELYPNDIMKFLVWVAPPELQSAIGDMVRSAYKMENESKQLLQEAKSRVEQLIEEAAVANQ